MQKVNITDQRSAQNTSYLSYDDVQDRKYFDSGDYALSKAGVAPQNAVGTAIPNPEKCVCLCIILCPGLNQFYV